MELLLKAVEKAAQEEDNPQETMLLLQRLQILKELPSENNLTSKIG